MKVDVYNIQNKVVGSLDAPENVFGAPWRPNLVHQALRAQLANLRRPWAHAKGRGEVSGGGRKPWRQKGTGRARHGSIRSPLWIGGGKVHGPVKTRDYSQKLNKKMRRAAIFSLLSKRFKDGEVKVFDSLEPVEAKTKMIAAALRDILNMKKSEKSWDVLLIGGEENKNLGRAARNLPKTKVLKSSNLNVYDLLNHRRIFIEQSALPHLGRSKAEKTRS